IYSFDGKLLAEYNTSGVCVRDYIYMGNQLIAEYDPASSQYYYYTSDQINSTRIVTDGTGAVVYAAAHDPYGGIQKTWVSTFDPVPKFSGKEHDGESQLDYFGARYYDRSQYRFISTDPDIFGEIVAGDVREMNHYAYSGNNPLGFMDIDGLKFISVQDAQQIVRIAALWASANTLYDGSKGRSSARGISGDCCGTTWGIYKEAGYEYEFKPANEEFTKSLREGGENHDKLQVAPGNIPQVGDIGYYNGHMCIYAGVDTDGKEWIWTTSSTKGKYVKMELWRFLYNTKNEFEWFRWYIPDSPPAEPVSKI
ncbi:MAG TPA: RHS repeat-associated core domain-containing protein, partial [Candidatus Bathyarchaeia archaeon]|nr:RHS repeat-associated core domain-containing protein [Candidatus Bathyarchaeia archaeon]